MALNGIFEAEEMSSSSTTSFRRRSLEETSNNLKHLPYSKNVLFGEKDSSKAKMCLLTGAVATWIANDRFVLGGEWLASAVHEKEEAFAEVLDERVHLLHENGPPGVKKLRLCSRQRLCLMETAFWKLS
jgi:hypothetical protein